MTDVLVATNENQGLASLLTDVSSIANYKKASPPAVKKTVPAATLGSTAAAASLLADVSSIANYKKPTAPGDTAAAASVFGGLAHYKRTNTPPTNVTGAASVGARRRIDDLLSKSAHNTRSAARTARDDQSLMSMSDHAPSKKKHPDPNDNSVAFYDVFDYSMSDVDTVLKPHKAPPKKRPSTRASMSAKLERVQEQSSNVSVSETYNVFDFSMSSVDPKLIEDKDVPKKRTSRRTSVGGLSEDHLAAARARTRRAGTQVKQRHKERPQRPGMQRRNSFGSVRDLNANHKMDSSESRQVPRSPGAGRKPRRSISGDDPHKKTPKSPGATSHQVRRQSNKELMTDNSEVRGKRVRGRRSMRGRASLGRVDQCQKQQLENAVKQNQELLSPSQSSSSSVKTVRRMCKIQQSFQKASVAASEYDAHVITACPMDDSSERGGEPKQQPQQVSEGLQTLSQGVMSSLTTLSGLKKKLLRTDTK